MQFNDQTFADLFTTALSYVYYKCARITTGRGVAAVRLLGLNLGKPFAIRIISTQSKDW